MKYTNTKKKLRYRASPLCWSFKRVTWVLPFLSINSISLFNQTPPCSDPIWVVPSFLWQTHPRWTWTAVGLYLFFALKLFPAPPPLPDPSKGLIDLTDISPNRKMGITWPGVVRPLFLGITLLVAYISALCSMMELGKLWCGVRVVLL